MSSLYLRNGLWQIQYFADGKKVQRSLSTSSRKRAEALQAAIDREMA